MSLELNALLTRMLAPQSSTFDISDGQRFLELVPLTPAAYITSTTLEKTEVGSEQILERSQQSAAQITVGLYKLEHYQAGKIEISHIEADFKNNDTGYRCRFRYDPKTKNLWE